MTEQTEHDYEWLNANAYANCGQTCMAYHRHMQSKARAWTPVADGLPEPYRKIDVTITTFESTDRRFFGGAHFLHTGQLVNPETGNHMPIDDIWTLISWRYQEGTEPDTTTPAPEVAT